MPTYKFNDPIYVHAFIKTLPTRTLQQEWYSRIRKGLFGKEQYINFPQDLKEFMTNVNSAKKESRKTKKGRKST